MLALIGERGRELREFVENALGKEGMKRAIVVTATSDRSPVVRRRCAWAAMAVAEHFRDQGAHVLLLADSITRFAEAHREVAVAAGELPSLRGYPPSTAHMIMSLCERAGPGPDGAGDITALFSVLVAGSDMEEPVADILRGVLDGHVVLDRAIAERGRFPAIDLLRSVSRSLPQAASEAENKIIGRTRQLLGAYEKSELMIRAGLYAEGSDPVLDQAIPCLARYGRIFGKTCQGRYRKLVFTVGTAASEIRKPRAPTDPRNDTSDPQWRTLKTIGKTLAPEGHKRNLVPDSLQIQALSFCAG